MKLAGIIFSEGTIILFVLLYKNVSLPQFSEGKDSTIIQNKKIYLILFSILMITQSPSLRWSGQIECCRYRHTPQKAPRCRF